MAELSDEEKRAERILDLRIKKQELTDKVYRLNRQLAKVYQQLDAEMKFANTNFVFQRKMR